MEKHGQADEEDLWGDEWEEEYDPECSQKDTNMELEHPSGPGYEVLSMDKVRVRVLEKMKDLQELFAMDVDSLILIARHYRWNEESMQTRWFEEQEKLKYKLGIEFNPQIMKTSPGVSASLAKKNGGYCQVCYSIMNKGSTQPYSLACGHEFCIGCTQNFYIEQLRTSQGIDTYCMQHGCNLKVGHSNFLTVLKGVFMDGFDIKQKNGSKSNQKAATDVYWKWLCKSFTDDNKDIKWCPEVSCDLCIMIKPFSQVKNPIECECGAAFCVYCAQKSHEPVDCEAAKQWELKNNAESENVTWIIANTKPCPKKSCGKPIEKNQGCNHMTCRSCGYDFCWVCQAPWSDHGSATGGYYKCNKFEELSKDPEYLQKMNSVQESRNELAFYTFHFERYMNHEKAEKLARKLRPVLEDKIQQLHNIKSYPISELEFLMDTLNEVIRCRQVLKWTYVYAFYMPKTVSKLERDQFDFNQTDLEKYCDTLHGMIEAPLDKYLDPNILDRSPFFLFKGKAIGLYGAIQKYYQSLTQSLREQSQARMFKKL